MAVFLFFKRRNVTLSSFSYLGILSDHGSMMAINTNIPNPPKNMPVRKAISISTDTIPVFV